MRSLGVQHYVLVGLLAWGLPGVFVGGGSALLYTACAALPVWVLAKRSSRIKIGIRRRINVRGAVAFLALALVYLLFDALAGRQKFGLNLFLLDTATANFVESANDAVSQGRGAIELLGATLVVLPFALIDAARLAPIALRLTMWSVACLYIFYDLGISRGYLLMAIFSILAGKTISARNLTLASSLALGAFFAASVVRGDFQELAFSNPLVDAVVWPYINLSLMLETSCGGANWVGFILEFVKKFLPSMLIPKEIFSFNIEMTRCIYPSSVHAVGSISIFTWLGEIYYYSPSALTAAVAGTVLALLCRLVDVRLERMQLHSLRVFSGLMCIVLLRSRTQDAFSFLLLLLLFLIIWRTFTKPEHRKGSQELQPLTILRHPGLRQVNQS